MPRTSHLFSRNRAGRSAPRAPPRSTQVKKKAKPKAKEAAGPSPRLQKRTEPADDDTSSADPQPDTAQDQQPLSSEVSDDDESLGAKGKDTGSDASIGPKRKKRRMQEVIEVTSDESDDEEKPSKLDVIDVAMLLEDDRVRSKVTDLLSQWHKGARKCARVCTPFPNAAIAFALGLNTTLDDNDDDEGSVTAEIPADELAEYKQQCDIYLKEMPYLKRDLQRLLDNPKATLLYAKFITDRASAQRGDDIGSIVDRVIGYTALIPELAKYHGPGKILAGKLPKSERGWHHPLTAELLCPQTLLATFKLDPEQFMADVRAEKHEITADDHASFLYDQTMVDEDDPRAGLLRGPLVCLIYLSLYMGPNAVMPNSERSGGRPSFAHNHNMTQCCPRSIVYAAVLTRHVLNSQKSWGRADGGVANAVFARRLLEPFASKAWSRDTLAWWNKKIFGTESGVDDADRRGPRANSAAAKIAALIAAEKAAEEGTA